MPKINHISFDLDGTLIDSLPLMRESWTHATEKIGVDTPWIPVRENIGLQFEKICANLGLENVSNELADEYFGFNRENLHKIQPMPKLNVLLDWLAESEFTWSIITSKPRITYEVIEKILISSQKKLQSVVMM